MTSKSTDLRRRDSQTSFFSDSSINSEAPSPQTVETDDVYYLNDPTFCVICGCNDQSDLGQNKLTDYSISENFDPKSFLESLQNVYSQSNVLEILLSGDTVANLNPKRFSSKIKLDLINKLNEKISTNLIAYDVANVGFKPCNLKLSYFFGSLANLASNRLRAHLCCVVWSHGALLNNETNSVINLDRILCESILRVRFIL